MKKSLGVENNSDMAEIQCKDTIFLDFPCKCRKNFITLHRNRRETRMQMARPRLRQDRYYFVVAPCKVRTSYQARGKFFIMVDYKKVYENAFGIKWDRRLYEVHHLDHNRENNNIENLLLIPKQLHRQLHLAEAQYAMTPYYGQSTYLSVIRMVEAGCVCGGHPLLSGLSMFVDVCNKLSFWGCMKSIRYMNPDCSEIVKIEGIWNAK